MTAATLTPLYSAETIGTRVRELAGRINADYEGKHLVMVCILKGAFMFFADLVRHVNVSPEIDFVRVSSYGMAASSSREVRITKDVDLPLAGKDVLVVEDVVDSGLTLSYLLEQLRARGANSLRVAALVDKKERRETEVHVDYAGFELSSGFIVGYGLDYAERYRELPAIHVVELAQ